MNGARVAVPLLQVTASAGHLALTPRDGTTEPCQTAAAHRPQRAQQVTIDGLAAATAGTADSLVRATSCGLLHPADRLLNAPVVGLGGLSREPAASSEATRTVETGMTY